MAKKKPAEPERKGRGRPATGRVRAARTSVYMTAEEKELVESAAEKAGMNLSAFLLHAAIAVAKITRK